MRLSIITVSYNSARTIERTIDSVLHQGQTRTEHLVIDGGSTDGTVDIIRKHFELGHISKYVSERDEGISDAFNKGIAACSGDIIGILNSDDYYTPGALDKVMRQYEAVGTGVILHANMIRESHGTRVRIPPRACPHAWKYVDAPFNHPGMFIPRAVYQRVGVYDKRYRYAMDFDFYLRAMKAGIDFVYLHEDIAVFSNDGASVRSPRVCHREVLRSQRENGLFPPACYLTFTAKMLISHAKRLLGLYE